MLEAQSWAGSVLSITTVTVRYSEDVFFSQAMLRALCEAIQIDYSLLLKLIEAMPEDGMGGLGNLNSLRDPNVRETCELRPPN